MTLLILLSWFGLLAATLYLAIRLHRLKHAAQSHHADVNILDTHFASIMQAAQVGLWDWDMKDRTLEWSGYAYEIMGAKSNDDIPREEVAILDMIPDTDRNRIRDTVGESIEKNQSFSIDYRTKRMDGSEAWVQSRGKVVGFDTDGSPRYISGTLMNISRQKAAEEELRRSNAELEQFAYVASHDLKAPLRGIDQLAGWILEDAGDRLDVESHERLSMIRGRVERLSALLNGILAYSRAGRIVDELCDVDTARLAREMGELVLTQDFKLEVQDDMPTLLTSRSALEQIFSNLIGNAVKHHDKGTGLIKVRAAKKDDYYQFTIEDDGPGIAPEFHDHVFQMFKTLKPQDREGGGGSGLGMTIVRKLIEWQKGKIWVESDGQNGTAVHFLWPETFITDKTHDG